MAEQAQETREATVASIRWEDPQGGPRRILKMHDKSIWIGAVGNVLPGTTLRASGHVDIHPRFGAQFVVGTLLSSILRDADGAEAWLVHRLPQIGEVRARQLVQAHGDRIWGVIEHTPQALEAVNGITHEIALDIRKAFLEHKHEQRVVTKLLGTGLRMHNALAAYGHFGQSIDQVLEADPYDLMDVNGITFELADATAQSLGVQRTDPRRAKARARAKLEEILSYGDCHESVMTILGVVKQVCGSSCSMQQAMQLLIESKHITVRSKYALLRSIDHAEGFAATRLGELAARSPIALEVEPTLPAQLDPSQAAAVRGLLTDSVCVLTGGPGTGKTTTLKAALTALEDLGYMVRLAAPTGKAAKRMTEVTGRRASTIHKLLEWSPQGWKRDAANPIEGDVVVIDESSMVDIQLFAALLTALGHARLILVGDVDQLPPVGPGQPLENVIRSGLVPVYRLTTTHRQAGDSWVIDNARRVIDGKMPSLEETDDFAFREVVGTEEIVDLVGALYEKYGRTMQVLTPEHKNGAGTVCLNLAMQRALNPNATKSYVEFLQAGDFRIYEGDKVLFTRNDGETGLVNGDMGTVIDVFTVNDRKCARVDFDGVGEVLLESAQVRSLTLAYAMTVHKSQGSEWPVVVVIADPAHSSLRRELLYTAITRTSKLVAVIGTQKAVEKAVNKKRENLRRTLLIERMKGELS